MPSFRQQGKSVCACVHSCVKVEIIPLPPKHSHLSAVKVMEMLNITESHPLFQSSHFCSLLFPLSLFRLVFSLPFHPVKMSLFLSLSQYQALNLLLIHIQTGCFQNQSV